MYRSSIWETVLQCISREIFIGHDFSGLFIYIVVALVVKHLVII